MKAIRTIILALAALAVLLVVVVLIRTLRISGENSVPNIALPPPVPVNVEAAAQHLGRAVQFQTVSHDEKAENDLKAWESQRDWLAETYPKFHAAATREIVGDGALLYTWKGTDPSLEPIILMAHQDVVPVAEESLKEWKAPPFSGAIVDGAVWGRGSVDDKGSLIALMEAVELLAAMDFQPRRTIILVSGNDEETWGSGALAAAEALKARGVHAQFALDEGGAVVLDSPLTGKPVALIGVAEKGYATLRVTVRAAGGHSSAPPKDTGAATLARAVVAINDHGFPLRFRGPMADMLKALGPRLPFSARMAVANDWLFGPILVSKIAATPAGAASLHTTTAPTMLSGSPKDNVLPTTSIARINYRIMPGDTSETVMANARLAVGQLPVELSWDGVMSEPSPVSSDASDAFKIIAALANDMSHAPAAPSLVTGATDSRRMAGVARDIYRFMLISVSPRDIEMIHGINEHISLKNLESMIQFYARLIEMTTAALKDSMP